MINHAYSAHRLWTASLLFSEQRRPRPVYDAFIHSDNALQLDLEHRVDRALFVVPFSPVRIGMGEWGSGGIKPVLSLRKLEAAAVDVGLVEARACAVLARYPQPPLRCSGELRWPDAAALRRGFSAQRSACPRPTPLPPRVYYTHSK